MSDFDAARKRLEEYASHPEWANDLGQLPILLTDIRLLLAEVERKAMIHGRTLIPELVEKDREILRLRNALSNIESTVAARLADSDLYAPIMSIIVKEITKVNQ